MSKISDAMDSLFKALEELDSLPDEKDGIFMVSVLEGQVNGVAAGSAPIIVALLVDAIQRDPKIAKVIYSAIRMAEKVNSNDKIS